MDGVCELCADIEHAVRPKLGAMWADRLTEVNDLQGAACPQVNDVDGAAISAGFADARIAVNRNIAKAMARLNDHFVAVDIDAGFGHNLPRIDINDQGGVVKLIGDEEESAGFSRAGDRRTVAIGNEVRQKEEDQEKRFHD